jgi:hypothetical protein
MLNVWLLELGLPSRKDDPFVIADDDVEKAQILIDLRGVLQRARIRWRAPFD